MGEAKRRRDSGHLSAVPIKMPPRKKIQSYRVVLHKRFEEQDDNGMVYARSVFAAIDDDGHALFEETPDGPAPVLLMSIRQPIRRSVLAASGLVTR